MKIHQTADPSPIAQTPDVQESFPQITLIIVATVVPTVLLIAIMLSITIATIAIYVTRKKSSDCCSSPVHCSDGENSVIPE